MAWTALPEVPWWTLFTGMLWSMVWVTLAYLVVSTLAGLVSAVLRLRGRGEGL